MVDCGFDTDYGNYRDFDEKPHWSDDFNFRGKPKDDEYIADLFSDLLIEAACVLELDTSEWDSDDWALFSDLLRDRGLF